MQRVIDGVWTRQSKVWQTNTGIVETGTGVIVVDPGVLGSELAALVDDLAGRLVVAGFATHYHWDHILWSADLGPTTRFASPETCDLVEANRDRLERSLDAFETSIGVEPGSQWDRSTFRNLRPMPLGPGMIASVPCELVDVSGHCDGQTALVLPDHDVAFVADTLSDIEVPSLAEGEGQLERYMATLDRLQMVIERVSWIIPGHGAVADRHEAQRRLELDRSYLERLAVVVPNAPTAAADDDLAATILADLGETRANEGLSAQMHLDNVRMLRENR